MKQKLKCQNPECLYEWETTSEMMQITCPSCRLKTKNPKFKKKKSK